MSNKKPKIQKDVGPVLENTVNSDPKPLETPQNLESSENHDLPVQGSIKKEDDNASPAISGEGERAEEVRTITGYDSTSPYEVSSTSNEKYSGAIIAETFRKFNLARLETLKKTDLSGYLDECKQQMIGLWKGIVGLEIHNHKFTTLFHIKMGRILIDVQDTLKDKAVFYKWRDENFGRKHRRYFQEAQQLAQMGQFAEDHSPLGKTRLLEFNRLLESTGKSLDQLLRDYPFDDAVEDEDGVHFSFHVDAIITFYRTKEDQVIDIEFGQAEIMVSLYRRSIKVKEAKKLKEDLDASQDPDKKKVLDDYILNGLIFPDYSQPTSQSHSHQKSLDKLLTDLLRLKPEGEGYSEWIIQNVDSVETNILDQAFNFIMELKVAKNNQPQAAA